MQLGDSLRAAYQALVSYTDRRFSPIPLHVRQRLEGRPAAQRCLRVAITLLAVVCAAIPTAEVTHVALFELKLALGTAAMIGSAAFCSTTATRIGLTLRTVRDGSPVRQVLGNAT